MKPAKFMQQPLAVIVQQLLVEELLEVKKSKRLTLREEKIAKECGKENAELKNANIGQICII